MYSVNRSALVPHSAEQMFELVNDINRYQEFLPWCGGSREIKRVGNEVTASVTMDFKGIRKAFTTSNKLEPYTRMDLRLVDGPFSDLSGSWTFVSLDQSSCKVILNLAFDFPNSLAGKLVGPVFKGIADSMVDSFCSRADQIYAGNENAKD